MIKTESKVFEPTKPRFYRTIFDDITNKRHEDLPDNLFQALNSNHPKIKYTIEKNPNKSLDTKIIQNKGIVTAELNWRDRNFLVDTPFRSSKRYGNTQL